VRPIAWLGLMLAAHALALFSVAVAGPLEDGEAADQRGEYATAMGLLRPLADQRNAAAQTNLGWMYAIGHDLSRTMFAS
jgi:TPR repeat protein